MSSFCPVLEAMDLAIATASKSPKKAIAAALLDRLLASSHLISGNANVGSERGTANCSFTPDTFVGSKEKSTEADKAIASNNSGRPSL